MAKENEKIAERAYYKYLERGSEHGKDMNDWLEAEKEVKNGKKPARKKATTAKKTSKKLK